MSSSEAPFEVRVSETMQALWNELGLDDDAQQTEFGELREAFQQVYQQFVDKLSNRCKETRSEIEHVQSIHKQAMKAYGLSESDINDALPAIESANLLEQLETAKQAYQNFKMTCSDRIQKLEGLAHTANDMFDALGVPAEERGEYAEVGDIDYSRARIERFRKRIQELKSDVEERTREVRAAKTTINNLVTELKFTLSDADKEMVESEKIDTETLKRCKELTESLEVFKKKRVDEISQLAMEITHLWELLNISDKERAEFLKSHSTIGEEVLTSCKEELERLSKMRDERIPELIEHQKQEALELYERLHIAVDSRPVFNEPCSAADRPQREFMFYEAEIVRLKKLLMSVTPIITSIEEREEIISEYETFGQTNTDAQRLLSRGPGYAQQLMREEKARRRYKVVLPRLDKKLYAMLKEYKEANGVDFDWDGEPYIAKLGDVQEDLAPRKRTAPKKKRRSKRNEACRTLPPSQHLKVLPTTENDPDNHPVTSFRGLPPFMI